MNPLITINPPATTASKYRTVENICLFIVEDTFANRTMLARYISRMTEISNKLQDWNLDIYTFENGEEALQKMHLKPDIIIADYYLDESDSKAMTGLTLVRSIKQTHPKATIIAVSSQQDPTVVAELMSAGASHYVSKEHSCHARVGQLVAKEILQKKGARTSILPKLIIAGLLVLMALAWILK